MTLKDKLFLFLGLMLSVPFLKVTGQTQADRPCDEKATRETVNLYRNLKKLSGSGRYLIGHQDALAYGVQWKYEKGRSDVKDVTGDYPAVYGWELGHLEQGSARNLDGVAFDKMREFIRQGYKQGGVITLSWHGINPKNGKSAWDVEPGTVASILPGAPYHDVYRKQLDRVATFLLSLKGDKGEYIPVLFRPFHELTGGWFWWGAKTTTPEEYKTLFRFTVDYLQRIKGIHHLLYVYNTSGGLQSDEAFLERYPGDDVVDILSFDTYQFKNPQADFATSLKGDLALVEQLAQRKNKVAAVAEMGFSQIPEANWWTGTVAPSLKGRNFAYVLFWRNAGVKPDNEMEYFVPYKGQVSEKDFVRYYRLPETLFQKEARALKLYK
ncbi:glycoside hydrolase family 26 protein [Arcticibacter sp. MXS-1]|uniref:glycoside hydrolase family 26 protein n=1 Tax=Arcticibacter sp. MXS-1 TaxID=3341726 RepID=UPI0035A94A3A